MAPSKLSHRPPNPPFQSLPRNSSMPNLEAPLRPDIRSPSAGPAHRTTADTIAVPKPPNTSLAIPNTSNVAAANVDGKLKRKSWFSGMSKDKDKRGREVNPMAWIAGQPTKIPYNIDALLNGARVPELWDESADTFVYLRPRSSAPPPSFKVHSAVYASSTVLTRLALAHGSVTSAAEPPLNDTARILDQQGLVTPPMTPTSQPMFTESPKSSIHSHSRHGSVDVSARQFHVYLEGNTHDQSQSSLESLVALRNLFAFLIGQSLIATERRPTVFHTFLSISNLLNTFGFSNLDGSTYGDIAANSFDRYIQELSIHDIRSSREKTIEALVLAEKMRSVMLYNEAFTHTAGKYSSIQQIAALPDTRQKLSLVSSTTRNRLERASIDLAHRERTINQKLLEFEFPSVFAGVMNSKTVSERKYINFDAWKSSFAAIRRHVLSYYKHRFGSWPPKAGSKKNNLETDGLNRLILKTLYADFSSMYDFYVDRNAPTPRSMGQLYSETSNQGIPTDAFNRPAVHILRRVLDEYDRSSPPVVPPIPFDIPLLPNPNHITKSATASDLNSSAYDRTRKLKEEQLRQVLGETTNSDARPMANPGTYSFLNSITSFEVQQSRGCTLSELVDLRAGMWIFMYAVLQALPLLVIDAPALQCHHGVEYFLCQPPRGGLPWVKAQTDGGSKLRTEKSSYRVSGSNGVVSLPSDLIEHGVQGVYHRSHCWLVAPRWKAQLSALAFGLNLETERDGRALRRSFEVSSQYTPDQTRLPSFSPSIAQPYNSTSAPSSRSSSRAASPGVATRNQSSNVRESSGDLGSEPVPIPRGVSPARDAQAAGVRESARLSRPVSREDAAAPSNTPAQPAIVATTFDDILGSMNNTSNKESQRRTSTK